MGTTSGYITRNQDLVINMDAANSRSYTSGSTTCECLVSTVSGTFENGTSFSPEFGGGWTFDGTNDYLNLGNRPGINPGLDSFTCNVFFKIDPSSNDTNIIASKGNNSSGDIGWMIYYHSINEALTVRCNGNDAVSQRAGQHIPINKGQVYMVTLVINRTDNTIKGYLNGSNVGWVDGNYNGVFTSNSISGFGSITNSDDFLIGERPYLNLPMFGTIYLFQTYNFALSEAQVYRNFRFFGGRYDLSPPPPPFNLNSFLLDGTDDYMVTSPFSTLDGATYLSMSFWVKVNSLSTTQQFIKSTEDVHSYQTAIYVTSTGMIQANIANNGANWTRSATGAITVGNWHHVVVTLDNTINRYLKLKIFVDGTQSVGGSNFYNAVIGNGVDLYVGSSDTPSLFLDGNIDEVSIWGTHTLTPSEISTLYNNGTPTNLDDFSTPPQNWWRMGENATFKDPQWLIPNNENKDKVSNYSMSFDGADDAVTMGNVLNMADDGTDAYSFSIWFKTTDNSTQQLIGKSATNGYNLYTISGTIYFGLGTYGGGGIWGYAGIGSGVYNGSWQHLVLTYDGSQDISGFTIYYNNVAKVVSISQNTTPIGVSTANHFMIGARGNTGTPSLEFDGNIDEASYFNSELTVANVSTIYNSGVPNDISTLSPLGWWRLGDESTFSTNWTIKDQGSGGNDGTSANMDINNRIGDTPGSENNALSYNMVLSGRTTDVPT